MGKGYCWCSASESITRLVHVDLCRCDVFGVHACVLNGLGVYFLESGMLEPSMGFVHQKGSVDNDLAFWHRGGDFSEDTDFDC